MARRKSKAKARSRSRKPAFNLTNAAQTLIVANGVSMAMFRTDLPTFLGLAQNFQGGYNASNNSNELTAKELFSGLTGMGSDGISHGADGKAWAGGIPSVLKSNLKEQIPLLLTVTVGVPIAFKLGKQLLAKPIINPLNRTLKMAGLKGVKV